MVFPDPVTKALIYGLSYFRNVPDASKKRGAVQMSMLLLLKKPFFLLFKPIVQEALCRFMDDHDVSDHAYRSTTSAVVHVLVIPRKQALYAMLCMCCVTVT